MLWRMLAQEAMYASKSKMLLCMTVFKRCSMQNRRHRCHELQVAGNDRTAVDRCERAGTMMVSGSTNTSQACNMMNADVAPHDHDGCYCHKGLGDETLETTQDDARPPMNGHARHSATTIGKEMHVIDTTALKRDSSTDTTISMSTHRESCVSNVEHLRLYMLSCSYCTLNDADSLQEVLVAMAFKSYCCGA